MRNIFIINTKPRTIKTFIDKIKTSTTTKKMAVNFKQQNIKHNFVPQLFVNIQKSSF